MTDTDLILAYKKGDERAFYLLYERYNKKILHIINQFTKENKIAEDYNQDIWILIILKIDKFKEGNFFMWVNTLAKNYCIDLARKNKRLLRKNNEFLYLNCQFNSDNDDTEDNLNIMRLGVDKLNDIQKKIIELRMQGHTYKSISKILNICLNTILSNSRYIKFKLRKHFYEYEY